MTGQATETSTERSDPRRRILLDLFRAALESVDGRLCVRDALNAAKASEREPRPVWAAAVGKAASAMMLGAHEALGSRLERGLLITKDDHVAPQCMALSHVETLESAHPMPDARSLAAGERLLQWVDEVPAHAEALFLISGGASSLVESLAPRATFAQLTALNARGLASGMTIVELNAERSKLSNIKGGRLAARVAARLEGRRVRALFISDVPGHDPAVIGSGLMGPSAGVVATSGAGASSDGIEREVVASIDHAMERVRVEAEKRGLAAWKDPRAFEGPAERLAVRFAHELHMGLTPVRVWGGESTVQLPESPGRGGRNQHLALAAARIIAGHDDLLLLVAGTDGTDGVTGDAGALVDGETCSRVALAELEVPDCLKRANSGAALDASGDLIHTGPTGTNVCDLVIGLKLARHEAETFVVKR